MALCFFTAECAQTIIDALAKEGIVACQAVDSEAEANSESLQTLLCIYVGDSPQLPPWTAGRPVIAIATGLEAERAASLVRSGALCAYQIDPSAPAKLAPLLAAHAGAAKARNFDLRGSQGFPSTLSYQEGASILAHAVEHLSIGVYLLDQRSGSKGRFTVWNKQMEELFELPKKRVLGKQLHEVFPDPLLQSILDDAKTPRSRSRAIVPRRSGSQSANFIADISKTPILDAREKPEAVIGIVHDVTERIQSENRLVSAFNELENSKERLEHSNLEIRRGIEKAKKLAIAAQASNKAKSFFLSNISHELRTPLTSIVSLTHALLEGTFGPMNPKQSEYLEIVSDSSKHLQSLITDILDLSKIELGKLILKFAPTQVAEIAQASMRMIMQQAQAKNVRCELTLKSAIEYVDVDAKRLRQVLLNLLYNAVKFTRPDSAISLRIENHPSLDAVVFVVSDEGIGISESDIEKIFTPFTQLDDSLSKQYEGTGLGLAIVSKLVELHGGGLSVKSEAGKGSQFSITLPASQVRDLEVHGQLSLAELSLEASARPFALVVDENERLAQSAISRLSAVTGLATVPATPNELAAYYDRVSPVTVLADLPSVAEHGPEWIHAAKAHPAWQKTRWVAIGSLDIAASHRQAEQLGFEAFLPRPIAHADLARILKNKRI